MSRTLMTSLGNLGLALILLGPSVPARQIPDPLVVMETELGQITVEVYLEAAPVTASNFLRYVDEGRFEAATFYRVVRLDNQPDNDVKIEVIQGGPDRAGRQRRLPSIEHETTGKTGIRHLDGVISMARNEPGSASSEFFICVGDQPELDFGGRRNPDGQGFAAFGSVVSGMDVVKKIQQLEPGGGQYLEKPVAITSIARLR